MANSSRVLTVKRFSREEFLNNRWEYNPGDHATFIGKTQSGKTTLSFQLLDVTTTPDLPGLVLIAKPKDGTPSLWIKRLRYRRVPRWPMPDANPWLPSSVRPRGWAVWPKLGDIHNDSRTLFDAFDHAMASAYARSARRRSRPMVILSDEMIGMTRLGLGHNMDEIWERGSGMGLGQWGGCQRPFNAPLNAYEQSTHLFLWRSTDRRNLRRYGEIGGIDAPIVHQVVSTLQGRDCLYIRRTDYTCCVVGQS